MAQHSTPNSSNTRQITHAQLYNLTTLRKCNYCSVTLFTDTLGGGGGGKKNYYRILQGNVQGMAKSMETLDNKGKNCLCWLY